MEKVVLYYSFSGHAEKAARDFAANCGGFPVEIQPAERIGKARAYSVGCLNAMKGKSMPIAPVTADLAACAEADVFAPIWAGCIAPPMLAALELLPKGAKVSLHLVSASGKSSNERNTAAMKALGLEVAAYEDIKKR